MTDLSPSAANALQNDVRLLEVTDLAMRFGGIVALSPLASRWSAAISSV